MKLHEVKGGETLSDIAGKYGVSEDDLIKTNGIEDGVAAGEELLILTPTRIHTARQGDTIERLCLRYRVRKNDVLALNPELCGKELMAGVRIALKYDERTHGMAVTNGCVYKGTTKAALLRALPYMTYATFACAVADKRGIHKLFDETELLEIAKRENKIPLLKLHDSYSERFDEADDHTAFCDSITKLAKIGGYKGIVLNACSHSRSAEKYSAFLSFLKKRVIGSDLIIITECDESTPSDFCVNADGSVFSYTKLWDEKMLSFDDGERKAIANFACECESAKSFIELPSFARLGDGFVDIESAKKLARKRGAVENDTATKTLSFDTGRGKCIYPSPSNVKAVLELLSEYGYMGVCFDVMRTPPVFLAMYNTMYKTVNYTASVSRDGCSRERNT